MSYLTGSRASCGITSGKAFIFTSQELAVENRKVEDSEQEKQRLLEAFDSSKAELAVIKDSLSSEMGKEFGHIFRAQMTIIEDEEFQQEVISIIETEKLCAEASLKTVYSSYSSLFSELGEDDYNRQRLLDLTDAYTRILRNLLGLEAGDLSAVPANSIIIAEDLMPSDTALMNKSNVNGLIAMRGGLTSHAAILAKGLGIPAAVGVPGIMEEAESKAEVLLDTRDFETAKIWLAPSAADKEQFEAVSQKYRERLAELEKVKGLDAVTLDGKTITLSANIGSVGDFETALKF